MFNICFIMILYIIIVSLIIMYVYITEKSCLFSDVTEDSGATQPTKTEKADQSQKKVENKESGVYFICLTLKLFISKRFTHV